VHRLRQAHREAAVRTGIEQARIDLLKWESRVAEDTAALAEAERHAEVVRERLQHSLRAADGLRGAVQRWEAMQARHEPSNDQASGARSVPLDAPVGRGKD